MKLIFSGVIVPVSTIDWYGRSVSVVFFNGCNFKCIYCSNNELIRRSNSLYFFREKKGKKKRKNEYLFNWDNIPRTKNVRTIRVSVNDGKNRAILNKIVSNQLEPLFMKGKGVDIEDIEKRILDTKSFISAVVFSGGEPTMPLHFEALEHLAKFAKEQGLLVGIETNGYYPDRLSSLIKKNLLDKIFLDIKAPLDNAQRYSMITGGFKDAAERVLQSLNLQGASLEIRTTVFRSIADVSGIAKSIAGHDCTYVIQQGIPELAPDEKIRNEKPLNRDEIIALAKSVSFLKDIRIRTREKGEERV